MINRSFCNVRILRMDYSILPRNLVRKITIN